MSSVSRWIKSAADTSVCLSKPIDNQGNVKTLSSLLGDWLEGESFLLKNTIWVVGAVLISAYLVRVVYLRYTKQDPEVNEEIGEETLAQVLSKADEALAKERFVRAEIEKCFEARDARARELDQITRCELQARQARQILLQARQELELIAAQTERAFQAQLQAERNITTSKQDSAALRMAQTEIAVLTTDTGRILQVKLQAERDFLAAQTEQITIADLVAQRAAQAVDQAVIRLAIQIAIPESQTTTIAKRMQIKAALATALAEAEVACKVAKTASAALEDLEALSIRLVAEAQTPSEEAARRLVERILAVAEQAADRVSAASEKIGVIAET